MSKSIQDRFKVVLAVYVLFCERDKVLLLRRANTGYHDGEYSLPAGHVDGGEAAVAAAIREAKEEVAVALRPEDLKLIHTMHRASNEPEPHERIDLFFVAEHWERELKNAEPHKCDGLLWAPLHRLPENVIPEVRLALESYLSGEPYSDFNFPQP